MALTNPTEVRVTTNFSILELTELVFISPLRGTHTRSNCLEPGYRHAWP